MFRNLILLVILLISAQQLYADKKKGSATVQIEVPQPDPLPSPCKPERPVRMIVEPQIGVVLGHTASSRFGIDVSHYQGNINWKEVASDKNVSFVYLKATESSGLVDNTYQHNLQSAKRAGIPVGAYHFFSPTARVADQLKNFRSVVDPKTQDLIPIVDVEKIGKTNHAEFRRRLKEFCAGVEEYFGVKPLIYTSPNFYNRYLANDFLDYPFMIARYAEEVPSVNDRMKFVLWQFTQTGRIKGIRGNVDRSRFMDHYNIRDILYRHK